MSIALESNSSGNRIERPGFIHGMPCMAIYDSTESGRFAVDRRFPAEKEGRGQQPEDEADSCSSSSIGRNSDSSARSSLDGEGDSGDVEVQSSYKGPLETMDALEEVLPVRQGISKFYSGKSKSFTSLADAASCSSIKDIVKPENAYTRKRKNLLAYSSFWDKNYNRLSRSSGGGISKRPANFCRSTLSLAVSMSSSEINSNSESPNSNSSSQGLCLPPLPPQSRKSPSNESPSSTPRRNFSPWRSLSLSDLQCAAVATRSVTGLVINNQDEDKLH